MSDESTPLEENGSRLAELLRQALEHLEFYEDGGVHGQSEKLKALIAEIEKVVGSPGYKIGLTDFVSIPEGSSTDLAYSFGFRNAEGVMIDLTERTVQLQDAETGEVVAENTKHVDAATGVTRFKDVGPGKYRAVIVDEPEAHD